MCTLDTLFDAFMGPEDLSVTDLRDERLWSEFGFVATETASGITVNPDNALALGAYFDGIRIIAEDIAKLPFPVYRRLKPRGKERDREHPVHRLLSEDPNPNMSAMALRETLTAHAIGWGGGFAVIRRNRLGEPMELVPIHPSRVRIETSQRGRLMYMVGNDDGTMTSVSRSRMFHLHGLGPDGINGYSVARVGAESIGRGLSATAFSASFFRNGSSPKGVLQTQRTFESDEAIDRLRQQWQRRYSGPEGWNRPIVLEAGFEWKPVSIPPEDAQLLQTEEFTVIDIARWLRIAPHKLGALDRATHSNIEEQNIDHVTDTLMPWARRWEVEVKRKLLSDDPEHFAEVLFAGLLRGSSEQRAAFHRELFNVGAVSQNDIRELENMNPIQDGDTYWVNSAMIPIQDAAAGMEPPNRPSGRIDGNDNRPRQLEAPAELNRREGAHFLLTATLERAQAKERRALSRITTKFDGERLAYEVKNFYAQHRRQLIESFQVSVAAVTRMTGAVIPVTLAELRIDDYITAMMRAPGLISEMDAAGSRLVEALAQCVPEEGDSDG